MRTRILTASAALTTAVAVAVISAGGTEAAATKVVKVEDYRFSPTAITVKRDTSVKFVWAGEADHDVGVHKAPRKTPQKLRDFRSEVRIKGSVTRKFTQQGTFTIDCSLHSSIMRMTIKVK